jgi:hypothetical protein
MKRTLLAKHGGAYNFKKMKEKREARPLQPAKRRNIHTMFVQESARACPCQCAQQRLSELIHIDQMYSGFAWLFLASSAAFFSDLCG